MLLQEVFTAQEIGAYWNTLAETGGDSDPFLGAALFPARQKMGLELKWLVGASGLPISLAPSKFDTKASLRDRIGIEEVKTQMPFFREGMLIKEEDRQELNNILSSATSLESPSLRDFLTRIYNDAAELVRGANVVPERMIMQLLSTGKIAIASKVNALNYDYDYKFGVAQKATISTATLKWSATDTATPVTDIIDWQDKVQEITGARPTRAICTRKTFGYLLANKSIKLDLDTNGNKIVTDNILRSYLLEKVGLSVSVYSKKYRTEKATTASYFPDNVFTLIPPGNLGNTWYGTTPEQSDLMNGVSNASVSIVNTGVAVTTIKQPHPVNIETIVSEIVLPSFEQGDKVFIATVA